MLGQLKSLAKALLAIAWVRQAHETATRAILEVFGSHRLLSIPYSLLTIHVFNREQFAVLRGRRDYYRNLRRARRSHTELRRNVHRLEKGISMQPRRSVFALDYLQETLDFLEIALCKTRSEPLDTGEATWACDVLDEYFRIVDHSNCVINSAYARYCALRRPVREPGLARRPYPRSQSARSSVAYEELLQLAKQRRSVRWFSQEPVPRDLIDKALAVAGLAPTACNRQPYEFRLYDEPAMVRKVASIPFGTAGYGHQIPSIAVVVGRLSHYFSPRDRHAIYVDASLAAMGFMFALETLGLASSVINWPDFEPLEIKMQRTLGLDADERVVMLIAIGYPDPEGLIPFSEKKPLDTLRRYNDLH